MEQTSGGDAAPPTTMSSPPSSRSPQPSSPHAPSVCNGASISSKVGTRPVGSNELFKQEDGESRNWTPRKWVRSWPHFSRENAARWASRGITFYTIHATCFASVIALATLLLWLSPKRTKMSFINALYNATSAVTVTGLMSIDIRSFSVLDQFTLLISMLLGSHIFTSLVPLYVRRLCLSATLRNCPCNRPRVFRNGIIEETTENLSSQTLRRKMRTLGTCHSPLEIPTQLSRQGCENGEERETLDKQRLSESERQNGTASQVVLTVEVLPSPERNKECLNGCAPGLPDTATIAQDQPPLAEVASADKFTDENQRPAAGRRYSSSFAAPCSSCARMQLEHKALQTLGWIVPFYFFGFLVVGFLVVQLYIGCSSSVSRIARENQVNQTVLAMFSTVAAMSNGGFSLLEDSMVPLQRSGSVLLITYGCLILLGNTMFAPTLRLIVWLHYRWAKGGRRPIYRYLLQNPRDCYTHLFPLRQTMWLVITITGFNAVETFAFCLLDWKSRAFETRVSAGNKLLVAAFQALNSRTAGMNVVDLVNLTPPMLILYLGMMYTAAYPVYISRQISNSPVPPDMTQSNGMALKLHQQDTNSSSKLVLISRKLVPRDSLILFTSMLVICLVENRRMQDDALNFSIFSIMFEVTSAYTNVGLSLGYSCNLRTSATPCTDVTYSFSGTWRTFSKLVLVLVMFFGRHRALADNLDRAISLREKPTSEQAGPMKNRRFHDEGGKN